MPDEIDSPAQSTAPQRSSICAGLIDRVKSAPCSGRRSARTMLVDTSAENRRAIEFFIRASFGNVIHHVYLSLNLESHPRYLERKSDDWDE